jgi:hypothetical protein
MISCSAPCTCLTLWFIDLSEWKCFTVYKDGIRHNRPQEAAGVGSIQSHRRYFREHYVAKSMCCYSLPRKDGQEHVIFASVPSRCRLLPSLSLSAYKFPKSIPATLIPDAVRKAMTCHSKAPAPKVIISRMLYRQSQSHRFIRVALPNVSPLARAGR